MKRREEEIDRKRGGVGKERGAEIKAFCMAECHSEITMS